MHLFNPKFTITNRMTKAITSIERARMFLEAAQLSADWVREMGNRALVLEAHHTTHIEGTRILLHPTNKTARTPFSSAAFRKAIRSNPWALRL